MRSRIILVAVVLLVVLLAASYGWSMRTPVHKGPLEKVIISSNTEYVGTCAIVAARDQGFFANEGIVVEIQSFSSGKASLQAVLTGKADLATVADIPVVMAAIDGVPVRVVATIFRTEKDHGLVARRDHGVVSPASLKGKRVGVTLNTSGQFTLDVFLNWQRLRSSDVTMVNYKPEELGSALVRGDVDAVAGWEPFLKGMRERLGDNAIAFSGEDVYESIYNLVGMQHYVQTRPNTVRRVLRALRQGSAYCRAAPETLYTTLPATARLNRQEVLAAWPSYRFGLELDQGLVLALEDRARWAIRNKMASKSEMPNFLEYIYLDGLKAELPDAVTIIH